VNVQFLILGPLEVLVDGRTVELGGARQQAVLAVLLVHANEVVPAERLIDAVWDDEPPQTARNVLQGYVSQLRKAIGADRIVTRASGYTVVAAQEELDLERFQRLVGRSDGADPSAAADGLRAALELWRGPPFADVSQTRFTRAAGGRLEELRLNALERRIEAELAIGQGAELVAELEALVSEHPLREGLRAHQMLALYRSGRQAEALEAFRAARAALVEELGLEPGPALQALERAILRHDPALDPAPRVRMEPAATDALRGAILAAPSSDAAVLPLCSIAEPLARQPARELIVVRLLRDEEDPGHATADLAALRDELVGRGLAMRVAAYTSDARGKDVVLLAGEQGIELLLIDAPSALLEDGVPDRDLAVVLGEAPCDVAVLVPRGPVDRRGGRPVVVPFGGAEHDWSAVELGAWTARSLGTKLRLVGTSADRFRRRRDASRLLGRASLVVQAAVGIVAEPVLVGGGPQSLLGAAEDASLLVLGLSPGWQTEGLGRTRLELARMTQVPTLLVRSGLRPGGLAPAESMTRFTWSLAPADP
jgi:DNA-binding SARP family transcriptional activator